MTNTNNTRVFFTILLAASALYSSALYTPPVSAQPVSRESRTVKFKWEPVDWGIRYQVQIEDPGGKTVLDKIVDTNSIEFSLPPGKYRLRIGIVNKFDKVGYWTDWTDTEIAPKPPWKVSALDLGIKVTAGVPYVQFPGGFDTPFENTFSGYAGRIGFRFGDFILFKPQDINYTGMLNYLGFELDFGYLVYTGKTDSNPATITTDMTATTVGAGLFAATNFRFPVNFVFRAGGGVTLSDITYRTKALLGKDTLASSQDPYYRVGAGIEFTFLKFVVLELGLDYTSTVYIDQELTSLRYLAMVGVKL